MQDTMINKYYIINHVNLIKLLPKSIGGRQTTRELESAVTGVHLSAFYNNVNVQSKSSNPNEQELFILW